MHKEKHLNEEEVTKVSIMYMYKNWEQQKQQQQIRNSVGKFEMEILSIFSVLYLLFRMSPFVDSINRFSYYF